MEGELAGVVVEVDGFLGAPDAVVVLIQAVEGAGGIGELVMIEAPDGIVDRSQRPGHSRQP